MGEITMIEKYISGTVRLRDICKLFNIHRSTVWRKIRRFREGGRAALVHRLCGRPSNNAKAAGLKAHVCGLYESEYRSKGFTPRQFYNRIVHELPEYVGFSTVRRWLRKGDASVSFP